MARPAERAGIELQLRLQRTGFTLDLQATLPGRGITALFGPSGCGKTTVLRALAGLVRAQGSVVVQGAVWQDDAHGTFMPPHQRPIGYVIQEAALFPHLSVQRNLVYGQRRIAPALRQIEVAQAVSLLGIGHLLGRSPATLSGGERQRVAIARALLTSPRLLLMDEPLAALDSARKAEILPYLERLHAELALPIVYVTHAMDEVARLADHLVLMADGHVTAAGPLHELLARPDLPLAQADDAGVVLNAVVAAHDAPYRLSRLQLGSDSSHSAAVLWTGQVAQAIGQRVRVRVLARDVSVVREPPAHSSILNVLPVVLCSVQADPGTALLGLALGPADPALSGAPQLLARITRRSLDALQLQPGDTLYAQIKGVSLMR
ncbi:MAG: molybdenum ABC transporter ATP-binding protein [Burkholderiales bacterium]